MNRTIFVPVLDSIWRFTVDWTPPGATVERSDNEETLFGDTFSTFYQRFVKADPNPGGYAHSNPAYAAWDKRFDAARKEHKDARWKVLFPAGTVVTFDRYHISHSGDHAITLRILASPDMRLHPKKQKGQMRGAGRIYLRVEELNTFPELEQVDDFQAG